MSSKQWLKRIHPAFRGKSKRVGHYKKWEKLSAINYDQVFNLY